MPAWPTAIERLLACGPGPLPSTEELIRSWSDTINGTGGPPANRPMPSRFLLLARQPSPDPVMFKRAALEAACGALSEFRRWEHHRSVGRIDRRLMDIAEGLKLPRIAPPAVDPQVWRAITLLGEGKHGTQDRRCVEATKVIEGARRQDPVGLTRAIAAAEVHDRAVEGLRDEYARLREDRGTVAAYAAIRERAFGSSRFLPALPGHLVVACLLIGGFSPLQAGAAASVLGVISVPVQDAPSQIRERSMYRAAVDRSRRFWLRHAGPGALTAGRTAGWSYADPLSFLDLVEQLAVASRAPARPSSAAETILR